MPSAFSKFFANAEGPVEFEIATGVFECQELGCHERVFEAKYIERVNTLTWQPPCGHISRIENFE